MDLNEKQLKRYLESYKRMFFKNQLDNARSIAILAKRKEVLNLKDIDLLDKELKLKNDLIKGLEFVENILGGEEELTEEKVNEIEIYFKGLKLDKKDSNMAVESVKNKVFKNQGVTNKFEVSNIDEKVNNSTDNEALNQQLHNKNEDNYEEVNIEEYLYLFKYDEKDLIENDEFFYDYLEIDKREFKIESLKVLFFNGCLISLDKLKDKILNTDITHIHNKENIINIFADAYGDLIDYTYNILIKEEICEKGFPKGTLFEKIFGLQCIDTLIKQMNKIGIMHKNNISKNEILKSVEKSINVYKSNSEKEFFKTISIEKLDKEIEEKLNGFKDKYNSKGIVEKSLINLFIEAIVFINKCGIANFDIYTEEYGRSLNQLIKEDNKIKDSIRNKSQYLSNPDGYMEILKKSIKLYPFNEGLYVELGYFKNNIFVKYDYLKRALDIIDNCGEKNSGILSEIESVRIDFYKENLSKIPNELSNKVKSRLAEYCAKEFNLDNDFNILFESEINKFGDIVSDIKIEEVDLDLRTKVFRKKIEGIKNSNLKEADLINSIYSYKEKYEISNWEAFKAEYSIFGLSYEDVTFESLSDYDRKSLLEYCMKSIKEIDFNEEEKIAALISLQDKNIVNKKVFKEIQYNTFGELIPLTELEKMEYEFTNAIKNIYNKYLESLIKLDISVKNNKDIFIPEFYNNIIDEDNYENPLFIYSEESNFSTKKEYFIITEEKIYTSYENNFVELKDIKGFNFKSYSRVIKGERIFFEGIFVALEDKEFKICSNLSKGKEVISKVLVEILDAYRQIFNISNININLNPLDNIVDFMDETSSLEDKQLVEMFRLNLEGNKLYELMSDVLNHGILDNNELILEVSKIISSELGKKIYFKEITDGYFDKLNNACTSYVLEFDKAEEILFVYDNSRFGSAKEGFIVTDRGVYCKNRMDSPWFIDIRHIDIIKAKDTNKILLNNRVIEFSHIKSKEHLYEMRDLLELVIFIASMNFNKDIDDDKSELMVYIEELLNSIKSENLRKFLYMHTEGKLAEKKFNNAVNSYVDLEENEKPLLLFDSSVFTFANSSFLVTTKNIYSKEGIGKSIRFNLGAVYNIKFKDGEFYINSVLLKFNSLSEDDKKELVDKMINLVDYLKEKFYKKAAN